MMVDPETPKLILASGSQARRDMLAKAGLEFDVIPADIDEEAIKERSRRDRQCSPKEVAEALAQAKAVAVSKLHPYALVIGSDQVLSLGTEILTKVKSVSEAREVLRKLRGKSHELHSAVSLARGGEVVWTTVDTALLTMWAFGDAFLDDYIGQAGSSVLQSVGCYQFEGLGARLFERVTGHYFTVLGMPLLPLLGELRRLKVIPS
jgi:septum formation protein